MFLRHKLRRKDGKEHRYWSIVENRRVCGGRTVQRHVLYLGEREGLPGQAVGAGARRGAGEAGRTGWRLARSGARRDKEQAMRRRLKKLVKRLHELRQQKLTRDQLLIKLGAARKEAGPAAWRIIDLLLPEKDEAVTPETFGFHLNCRHCARPAAAKEVICCGRI
jgi:hypothetical protein